MKHYHSTQSKLKSIILSFAMLFFFAVHAQKTDKPVIESFEYEKVLKQYDTSETSKLSLSSTHHKFGKTSLQWEWSGKSSFGSNNFKIVSLKDSPLKYGDHFPASPTLSLSIYNEIPQNETIKIASSNELQQEAWFEINLNFKGWRTIWVPYYEMQGSTPEKTKPIDFNYLKISTTASKGKLFFDDIVFSQYQDDRHSYPDEIVPFIKANQPAGKDHWMPLIQNIKRINTLALKTLTTEEKKDLKTIEKRLDNSFGISKKGKINMSLLTSDFNKLKLKNNGKSVVGPPMDFQTQQVIFDKNQQRNNNQNKVENLGKVLKKLASSYPNASIIEQQKIKDMFLLATRYFLDQGWQSGSSGGTRHHIGYNVRELAEGFFMMRKTLNKEGLIDEIGASLHWLFNLGMVLGDETKFHVNIDYLNTQAYYHLMLIFLVESPEKQAAILRAYKNYISITLAQQNQEWGFKIDGTAWHHNGHYPAYGMGAFRNVPKIIQTVSGTKFRIGTAGHQNFKNAFLATRLYSQKLDYGFGNAGRHPLEDNSIRSLKGQYLQMAYSGNPEGTETVDKEVAAAYMRLWGKADALNTATFTKLHNIQAEKLSGYTTFPYAATAIHRRNKWAAIVKGYSKYVWSSEIYVASNRYGRYPANGTVQLLNEKGEAASGYKQNGWDWNRYSGGTVIYLPFKELEPDTPLLMFRSKETFAGATELDGNGVFGMVLNESKGSNADGPETKIGFPGRLMAKKSVFSFGDKLICIGTNISSIDENNPVQTNLFQSALRSTNKPVYTKKSGNLTDFPYTGESGKWLIDPYGNGYHILSKNKTMISRKKQISYHNKYSIKTGAMNRKAKGAKETKGNFASAWLEHGNAPENGSYQYVIYPSIHKSEWKQFGKKVKKDNSFDISRADHTAHIVKDKKTKTTAYAIFEALKELDCGIVRKVSEPSLIMAKPIDSKTVVLSIVQPDLNFKEYKTNKFLNYSNPVSLSIDLNGKWNTNISSSVKSINHKKNTTTLHLECKDGIPLKIELKKL